MSFLSRVRETFCDKEAWSRSNVPGVLEQESGPGWMELGGWRSGGDGWRGVEGDEPERPRGQVMRRLVGLIKIKI